MVDILGIINELPSNPSEALIELNWRISETVSLFPKSDKKPDSVYSVQMLSFDNRKSYRKPTFDTNTYISHLRSNGKSKEKKLIPNYKPIFSLWETHKYNKEWMRITQEDILTTIKNKDTSDEYGANFSVLQSLIDLEPKLLDFMVNSYNRLLDHEICQEWSSCGLIPAHKGGDTIDPKNFRPLTILPIFVRIWDSIISKKLGDLLTNYGIIDTLVQRGVLKGVGGLSQNLSDVNRAMCSMSDDEICFFIDITNAYGSVNYGVLSHILREYNFSPALTKYVETYYMNAVASYNDKIFRWENGLYQGSGLSNVLFLIYMDYALKNVMTDLKMMRIIDFGFDLQKKTRAFVDDLVMFLPKKSYEGVIKFIQIIFRFYGLEINQKKTYFFMNDAKVGEIIIGDIRFERVHIDFKYLGIGLMCFREEFMKNYQGKIQKYLEEIDSFKINGYSKLYLYYRRVFQRINRTLKCYYAIFGRSYILDEIMKFIGYFIYRWTGAFPSEYLVKHIEYIGKNENTDFSEIVDFRTLFGIENPIDDNDFCEETKSITDPYLGICH